MESLFEDLPTVVVIDLTVLASCAIILMRYGRLAHSHPAVCYLFFHVMAITSRSLAILAGAETLFTGWGGFFEPVSEGEVARAELLADLALVAMTCAWVRASIVDRKRAEKATTSADAPTHSLSLGHIWRVVAIAFPIGLVGLALLGSVPGLDRPQIELGSWQESSWVAVTMTWSGLALLALTYWYGFRLWLVLPMGLYLSLMALQGYHRFRVVIPLILLLQIYLDRKGKRWPPAIVLVPLIAAMLLFYPMKTAGRMAQEGAGVVEITQESNEIIRQAIAGQHGDQTVLDQLACCLTLVDRAGNFYYGATYLALLTSPIPRQWWPEKPTLSAHLYEFSIPSRPMAEVGMVTTFIGEFYLNFGYFGIVVMSYLSAYWLARIYFRAYRNEYYSVLRFTYLLIACNLIQVYRDGLVSLFIFTLVDMMPLSVIIILHLIRPVRSSGEIEVQTLQPT